MNDKLRRTKIPNVNSSEFRFTRSTHTARIQARQSRFHFPRRTELLMTRMVVVMIIFLFAISNQLASRPGSVDFVTAPVAIL